MTLAANSTNGFWHEHTATIDWCESNYQVTHFIAEFWNTVSNLVIILFPLRSMYWCYKHFWHKKYSIKNDDVSLIFHIPKMMIACNVSLSLVGIGSWMFHMTLKYEMQLLDELPMIYGSGVLIYTNYDLIVSSFEFDALSSKSKMMNQKQIESERLATKLNALKPLVALLTILYCILFTYVYLCVWKNPIFHEIAYGFMVITLVVQTAVLIVRFNLKKRIYILSMFYYLVGFVLWNIDNKFCESLHYYRSSVEQFFHLNVNNSYDNLQSVMFNLFAVSLKSISEFHAWWHMFTGYAAFMNILFITEVYYQDHINRSDLTNKFNEIRPVESRFFNMYFHLTDNLIVHNEKLKNNKDSLFKSDIMTRSQTRKSYAKKD